MSTGCCKEELNHYIVHRVLYRSIESLLLHCMLTNWNLNENLKNTTKDCQEYHLLKK